MSPGRSGTSSRSGCSGSSARTAMWIGLAVAARRHGVREEPLLPLPVSGRRRARHPVEPDGVPHQALVRVQDVQDLREDVRVGRDSRTEDRRERMRALRRLRAPLLDQQKCPHWIILFRRKGKLSPCPLSDADLASGRRTIADAINADRVTRRAISLCGFSELCVDVVPQCDGYGASVGGCSRTNRPFRPDDTDTSFLADTITALRRAAGVRSAPSPRPDRG